MTILILHGIYGSPGENWSKWLKEQLEKQAHEVLMPQLPSADNPNRQEWLAKIIKVLEEVDHSRLIIIAHSLGVASAFDYIESQNQKIFGLVSVSGFLKAYGFEPNQEFMKAKEIDHQSVRSKIKNLAIVYSDNDPYVAPEALSALADKTDTHVYVVESGGHLNSEAGFEEFPLLLDIIDEFMFDKHLQEKLKNELPKEAVKSYDGPIFQAYKWKRKDNNGNYHEWEKLVRPDTVEVIPVIRDKVCLIKRKDGTLDIPAGRVDPEDNDIMAAVLRELKEETGIIPDKIKLVGTSEPTHKIAWKVNTFISYGDNKTGKTEKGAFEEFENYFVTLDEFYELLVEYKLDFIPIPLVRNLVKMSKEEFLEFIKD